MEKKKIIILSVYPPKGAPSQRFRFEQQLPYLSNQFEIKQYSFWSIRMNNLLYSKGNILRKFLGLINGIVKKIIQLPLILNAEIIFIHREILPVGSIFFEQILSHIFNKKIIFDFDDAIWNLDTSEGNKKFEWLKNSNKTSKIIALSNVIIAGNSYLANYAKQFNSNIHIIPTTIDTNYHIPKKISKTKNSICIGWTGSVTTIKHFELLIPVLKKLKEKYTNQIYFKLIGDANYKNETLILTGTPWHKATEIEDLQEIDIGVMPLPDDEWAKGKCGFKGLQYMALEIPAVMSPVGVNTEIIEDRINGFLADTENKWLEILSLLIDNKELRGKIGKEGRKTVINKYSIKANQQKYLAVFNSLVS